MKKQTIVFILVLFLVGIAISENIYAKPLKMKEVIIKLDGGATHKMQFHDYNGDGVYDTIKNWLYLPDGDCFKYWETHIPKINYYANKNNYNEYSICENILNRQWYPVTSYDLSDFKNTAKFPNMIIMLYDNKKYEGPGFVSIRIDENNIGSINLETVDSLTQGDPIFNMLVEKIDPGSTFNYVFDDIKYNVSISKDKQTLNCNFGRLWAKAIETIELYDFKGKKILNHYVENNQVFSVPVGNLQNGRYIVKLKAYPKLQFNDTDILIVISE